MAATHPSTLVSSAEPNAMPRTEESFIVIFCKLFYTGLGTKGRTIMRILKQISLTILLLVKWACLLPQSLINALKERRRWAIQKGCEAERLDRIRNPSKYLGK